MATTHRTANGVMMDMEKLRLQNEQTIAVGNLKTNARGDTLGPGGVPLATKQQTVNDFYNQHTQSVGAHVNPKPGIPVGLPEDTAKNTVTKSNAKAKN